MRIGAMTRCIPLPNALAGFDVVGAKLEDGVLGVTFAKGAGDER